MTEPLGPPRVDWGRDIGVPRKEHPKVQATESLREAEESSPRAAGEGSRSRPPPNQVEIGGGVSLGGCGRAVGGGGWAGGGSELGALGR